MYAANGAPPGNFRPEQNGYQNYQNENLGSHYGYAQNGQYDYQQSYQQAPPPPPQQGAPQQTPQQAPPPPQQQQQAPPPNHQGQPPPPNYHHAGYQNYGYGYQNTYQQNRPMRGGYNQMANYNQNGAMYNQPQQQYNNYQNGYNNYHQQPYGGGGDGRYMQKWNSMNSFSQMKAVDWNQVTNLVDVVKNFYAECPQVQQRTDEEVVQWRQEKQVRVQGTMQIKPILSFNEIQLPPILLDIIHRQQYEAPTTIQAQAWPIALSGADMVGIARTGSGKTLAFCLPAIIHIMAQPTLNHGDGPVALILSPTRELAKQVEEVARTFGKPCGIHSVAVYGGADKNSQISQLNKGAHIVVACPGRLLDLINQKHVNLHRTTYVVMDEADRMLDMGFEPQIRKVVGQIRKDRQTLMFSATWPQTVQKLANDFMNDPTQIYIGHQGLAANANITQIVEVIQEDEKADKFNAFFSTASQEGQKILVFTDTKRECDSLAWSLNRAKHRTCAAIHGDKDQRERERVLKDFRDGRITTLIATDVAARGLDIDAVGYVINYDFPHTVEDYVHRIGRTGRADNAGTAYSLITEKHSKCVHDLIKVLENANQKVPDELYKLKQQQRGRRGYVPRGRGRGGGYGHNMGYRSDNYGMNNRGGGGMMGGGGRGGGGSRGGMMNNYSRGNGHMNNRGGPPNRGRGSYRGGGGMNGNYQKHMPNGRNQQNGSFGQTWNGPPDISNLSINN